MQTTGLSTSAKPLERRVRTLAMDLGWTWCPAAKRAFAALDPREWEATKHAPLTTLQRMHPARLEACATDPAVLALFDEAERAREARLGTKAWFTRRHRGADARLRVAYFCSEYALHEKRKRDSSKEKDFAVAASIRRKSDEGMQAAKAGASSRRRSGALRLALPPFISD